MLQCRQLTDIASARYTWTRDGKTILSLTGNILTNAGGLQMHLRELKQTISLQSTPLHFGGVRWWFVCPCCSCHRTKLYLANEKFACRACLGLTYQSCQQSHRFDRIIARLAEQMETSVEELKRKARGLMKLRRPKWQRKRDRQKERDHDEPNQATEAEDGGNRQTDVDRIRTA
jgi:hypothetical protein